VLLASKRAQPQHRLSDRGAARRDSAQHLIQSGMSAQSSFLPQPEAPFFAVVIPC
jgi:hypothetical protein